MVGRIIEFCARNKFLVIVLTGVAVVLGVYCVRHIPLDAIPDLSDTQVIIYSRWDRSPDIIEDQVTYPIITAHARRAAGQGDPRVLGLRLLLRLRHFPGRHGPLLGAQPRRSSTSARSSRACPRACARSSARTRPASAGSTSTRWWTRPGRTTWRNCARSRTGTCATGSRACPAWPRSRRSADSRSSTRSTSIPNALPAYNIPALDGRRGDPRRATTTSAAGCVEFTGAEYMVRGRGYVKIGQGHREDRRRRGRRKARRSW